jgi:hypothetical protein
LDPEDVSKEINSQDEDHCVFRNLTGFHWICCYAIFLDLRIIQALDSMGGCRGTNLKRLHCWSHETMRIEGKRLDLNEWHLYDTCQDTPMQTYHNCGLYTVLFGLCVAKRYFLKIITIGSALLLPDVYFYSRSF